MTVDLAAVARFPRRWRMTRFPLHGGVIEEYKTAADVERMLQTAQRRDFQVHVDWQHITITRPGTTAKWMLHAQRSTRVSDAQWRDLAYLASIADKNGPSGLVVRVTEQGIRVGGHVGQLTAQASHLLIERGWILLPDRDDGRAALALAGRLNLERHRASPVLPKVERDMVIVPGHRTEAYEGRVLANAEQRTLFRSNGTRRGYQTRDGAGARCECGWTIAETTLAQARARARQHRIEQRERSAPDETD